MFYALNKPIYLSKTHWIYLYSQPYFVFLKYCIHKHGYYLNKKIIKNNIYLIQNINKLYNYILVNYIVIILFVKINRVKSYFKKTRV